VPTNLAIDDRLLQEAQKVGRHRTKRETVTVALQEYIEHRKQQEILEGGANLVEIDLLRGGKWVLAVASRRVRKSHRGPYRICVVRATAPQDAEMYRASFSRPLPNIRIPLRREDQDAVLRLQPLLDQSYANGQYDDLDYRQEPDPPLVEEERQWADELLKKAGRR
jgi:Arc/MetJ family transcription regulator